MIGIGQENVCHDQAFTSENTEMPRFSSQSCLFPFSASQSFVNKFRRCGDILGKLTRFSISDLDLGFLSS